jgi:pimeloyl-ACP methyl ester carboxylesterase
MNAGAVFIISAARKPREETFFNELLPFIEKEYRVNRDPGSRFLMGQSSGAWAALWLLVNYPDRFGGAYAGSPDPVDFTEFIGTNIYEERADMYRDNDGAEKRFANMKLNPDDSTDKGLAVRDLVDMDRLAGWGEQMYSFDAAFSKRGPDGEPLHLFNSYTGKVDPAVAASWEKYDLCRRVSRLDKIRKQALQSKIHIYVNDQDVFGLDEPAESFRDRLAKEGIDAEISIVPAAGHDVWTDSLRKEIHEDMDSKMNSITY